MKKTSRNKSAVWEKTLTRMLAGTRKASQEAAQLTDARKKKILLAAARMLEAQSSSIIKANAKDLAAGRKNKLSAPMLERLTLDQARVKQMAQGVRAVAALEDPIGKQIWSHKHPNGLKISRITVPLGVILIIYESRPNVTVECASLCIKSGNAVLLRGGREAFHSNQILAGIFQQALAAHKVAPAMVSFVNVIDREAVTFLLHREEDIHLVIPRGGASLIRKVVETSRIPVVKHYQGICHVYIDRKAEVKKAVEIAFNAKVQRPSVCNAMETLLVHQAAAAKVLPVLGKRLQEAGCEVRGDAGTRRFIPWAKKAKAADYGYEYLDKILAIRVVKDLEEALDHIATHGSGHTEAIVTADKKASAAFASRADASSVMINASTRFSDGFEYGLGAEIGISTDKIHARGPMGLEGLTSYKYVVQGNGQIRS